MFAVIRNSAAEVKFLVDSGADLDAKNARGETALSLAISAGDFDVARALVEAGADLNSTDRRGRSPLMILMTGGFRRFIVHRLILSGVDMDARDFYDKAAFKSVIDDENNHEFGVWDVINGISLNTETAYDQYGLEYSHLIVYDVIDEGMDLAGIFINAGADVNARDEVGSTALMLAVGKALPHFGVVRTLVDAGARLDDKDAYGRTALEIALHEMWPEGKNSDIIKFLLASGGAGEFASLNEDADAVRRDVQETETHLLEYGLALGAGSPCFGGKLGVDFENVFRSNSAANLANAIKNRMSLKIADSNGMTFFEAAIRYGSGEIVRECAKKAENVNEIWFGDMGVEYHQKHPDSWTLYAAADARNESAVEALLEAGAKITTAAKLDWHVRTNIFPEGEDNEEARKFKEKLDAGTRILRMLDRNGILIESDSSEPGVLTIGLHSYSGLGIMDGGEDDLTYVRVGYNEPNFGTGGGDVMRLRRAVSPGALMLLLDSGADVNARGDYGWTALHCVVWDYGDYYAPDSIIETLMDAGADIDARDKDGDTPLMLAIRVLEVDKRILKALKLLASRGADLHAENDKGMSPLEILEEKELAGLISGIFQASAPSGEVSELVSAAVDLMSAACWGGISDIERALSCGGADVNARCQDGFSPLMYACLYNTTDVVKFLLNKGADVDAENSQGENALSLSLNNFRFGVTKLLLAFGAELPEKSFSDPSEGIAESPCDTLAGLIKYGLDI